MVSFMPQPHYSLRKAPTHQEAGWALQSGNHARKGILYEGTLKFVCHFVLIIHLCLEHHITGIFFKLTLVLQEARIAQWSVLGYRLDDQGFESWQRLEIFSALCLHQLWGYPASYSTGTRGSFPGGKAARA
jgi:hypothetical protein